MKTNETYILSYIKGILPASEMKECDIRMISSAEYAQKVNQTKRAYYLFDNLEKQKKVDTTAAWKKLNRKIKIENTKKIIWNISRNAAAILLPLFLMFQYVVNPLLEEVSSEEIITLYSAPGIVTKAILPDGSEVWLNSQSELTYPRQFVNNERTVQLMGEAYFKVASDEKNRFNVVTPDNTIVSAYGTEFNVDAYNDGSQYSITLEKGNIDVALDKLKEKQTLIAGQKAIINLDLESLSIISADTYVETAWKDGKMVFRRESIKKIATKLARKFGVKIEVEGDTSKDYPFTATFTDESLEDILELLKLSTSIDYSISTQKKLSDNTYSQRIVTLICK